MTTIRQAEAAECGLASLAMIANWYGHDTDLPALRKRFGTSSRGMTLRQMMNAADSMGLSSRPLKTTLEALSDIALPAVLHWDMGHFVVLEELNWRGAVIHDPAIGRLVMTTNEVGRHYTGVAVEMKAAADFKPSKDRQKLQFRQLWSKAKGIKRAAIQAIALSVVLQIHALASPYLLKTAVDRALPLADGDLLAVLALGFIGFGIIYAAASTLRAFTLLAAGSALSFSISTNVARHLLRLPLEWFEKRSVGDVLTRFQSIQPIQRVLTENAAAAAIDGVMAAATIGVMIFISPLLVLIPVVSAALYAVLRFATIKAEQNAEARRITAYGKEQGSMIEALRGIATIRLAGAETLRHSAWQNKLTESIGARYAHERIRALVQNGGLVLSTIEQVVVVWMAIIMAMRGSLTVGTVFAFMAYRMQFASAVRNVIEDVSSLMMTRLHLDQLSDIALSHPDIGFAEADGEFDFKGGVSLKDVSFRYSPDSPWVLQNIDLNIAPGEHVAITGPSGGGKTTLVKILLGLLEPTQGEVLVDDKPLTEVGRRAFRRHVGTMLQDDTLFAGSIIDNVTGFDAVDSVAYEEAITAASIRDDINTMPMGSQTLVGDMGSTLSGGQRQRVLLARALYSQPRLLVLDEGTAHLDLGHENAVNNAIASMRITRIIVAHRRETVEAANRVVTIDHGKIVGS